MPNLSFRQRSLYFVLMEMGLKILAAGEGLRGHGTKEKYEAPCKRDEQKIAFLSNMVETSLSLVNSVRSLAQRNLPRNILTLTFAT